jgi:hypoxanthine phosphoribosyltransferase
MIDDVTVLLSEDEISKRLDSLAAEIDGYYQSTGVEEVIVVCVLKGSLVFTADLVRKMQTRAVLDFLRVSSYDGTMTTGNIVFKNDLSEDITGKHLLIIEDIIDTGNTLKCVIEKLWEREPQSIKLCSFLDKPARRTVKIQGDFIGFSIPDKFVVGYGLDYNEQYRDLPFVGVLKPEVYGG